MKPEGSLPHSQQSAPLVGPCHQGTARPQVVAGETASSMEGSCEYIE